jgi:hypothetical protein
MNSANNTASEFRTYLTGVSAFMIPCWVVAAYLALTWLGY